MIIGLMLKLILGNIENLKYPSVVSTSTRLDSKSTVHNLFNILTVTLNAIHLL